MLPTFPIVHHDALHQVSLYNRTSRTKNVESCYDDYLWLCPDVQHIAKAVLEKLMHLRFVSDMRGAPPSMQSPVHSAVLEGSSMMQCGAMIFAEHTADESLGYRVS